MSTTKTEESKGKSKGRPRSFASIKRTFAAHHANPKQALEAFTNWESKGSEGVAPGCTCETCKDYRARAADEEDFDE